MADSSSGVAANQENAPAGSLFAHGFVSKVCGLTRAEDVLLCHQLGVRLTGFIFAPKSPRLISPVQAASLPDGPSARVGVFAGASVDDMLAVAETARLDFLQLHGGESPEICAALGPQRVIKVLWPAALAPGELERELERFAPHCACFLFDAGRGGGGSGASLDFAALAGLQPLRPWLLAGGLGPHNLGQALKACGPDGVDLNSALERAPGAKDHDLLRQALVVIHEQRNRDKEIEQLSPRKRL